MVLSNDPKLFETYLTPVLQPAYGFAYYLLQDSEAAEALVQETALRTFRVFPQYQSGINFTVWFLKALMPVYFEMLRQEDRTSLFAGEEEAPPSRLAPPWEVDCELFPGNEADSDPFAALTGMQIASAFAQLPLGVRVIVALYFMAELSYPQIADILGCPLHRVRVSLHRGRWTLHHLLRVSACAAGRITAAQSSTVSV